tara:strand:- start:9551 stop:10216 length:666 start_codon:yes stop_codon:yes gene_type:complete
MAQFQYQSGVVGSAGGPDTSGDGWVLIEEVVPSLASDSANYILGTTTNGPWTDYQVLQLRWGGSSTNTTAGTHVYIVVQMGHTGTSMTGTYDLAVNDHYQASERGWDYYGLSNPNESGYQSQIMDQSYSTPTRNKAHGTFTIFNPNDTDNFKTFQSTHVSMSAGSEGNKAGHDIVGDVWGQSDWTNAVKNLKIYMGNSSGSVWEQGSYMLLYGLATGSSGS